MSHIYQLPNNAEKALRKARNYLSQNQVQAALPLLEQSYQEDPQMDVLADLAYAYMVTGQTNQLKQVFQEAPFDQSILVNQPDLAPLYRQSLHQIYQSKDLLVQLYGLRDQTQNSDLIEAIDQDIAQVKEAVDLEGQIRQAGKESFLSDFYQKESLQQLSQLKQIYQMDPDLALDLVLDCLRANQVNTFTKSDILHYLLFKGPKDLSLTMTWFDQEISLDLDILTPYQADPLFQETSQAVYQDLQKHDPQLTDMLMEQFTIQALFFYPCFKEVFGSSKTWAQAFLYYNLDTSDMNPPKDPDIQARYPQVLQDLQSMFLSGPA